MYFNPSSGTKKSQQIHVPEGNTSYEQAYHHISRCVKPPFTIEVSETGKCPHESTFIVRMKTNSLHEEINIFRENSQEPVRLDADIMLTGKKAQRIYPEVLRKVVFHDDEYQRTYTFITNNFELSAEEIAEVYKTRWQLELFFKWIKQHLKIRSFWGTSRNAVMTQIWIAIITVLLLWIHRISNQISVSAHQLMSLLKTTLFTKNTISGLLKITSPPPIIPDLQLTLGD